MTFVFILIVVAYTVAVFGFITGWIKATSQPMPAIREDEFISVVVACRNEAKTIGNLLDHLLAQQYPADKLEIIIVNDNSTDNTVSIVNDKIRASTFRCTLIYSSGKGKKAAITDGVSLAQGSVILTTDADCTPGDNWVQVVNRSFHTEAIKMTFGPVKIKSDATLFADMQAIEFASLVGSGAATTGLGFPTMCNGANLAFRKEAFIEVKGYSGNEHIASGDDEFLMRKVEASFPGSIRFNHDRESIVSTVPQSTLYGFLQQRIRWASKWKQHDSTNSKLLAVFVFVFNLSMILLPVFVLAGDISVYSMLALWVMKAVIEGIFLWRVTAWLGIRWSMLAFLSLQVVYSVYAVGVALIALIKKAEWKGRIAAV